MPGKPLVTIAFHIGLERNILLLENLIKSFLECNEYENIEIMLIESGGSEKVRSWLKCLDFESEFVRVDGKKTRFKKNKNVNIQKRLVFEDFKAGTRGTICSEVAHHRAIINATGEYFLFLPEDTQFCMKGNMIQDMIDILRYFDAEKTNVNLLTQQGYKYEKENNSYIGPVQMPNKSWVCVLDQMKWDPFCFAKRSVYLAGFKTPYTPGTLLIPSPNGIPHAPVQAFSKLLSAEGFKRVYSVLPAGIQMYNEHRSTIVRLLETNYNDLEYFPFKIMDREKVRDEVDKWIRQGVLNRPLATEDYPTVDGKKIPGGYHPKVYWEPIKILLMEEALRIRSKAKAWE